MVVGKLIVNDILRDILKRKNEYKYTILNLIGNIRLNNQQKQCPMVVFVTFYMCDFAVFDSDFESADGFTEIAGAVVDGWCHIFIGLDEWGIKLVVFSKQLNMLSLDLKQ